MGQVSAISSVSGGGSTAPSDSESSSLDSAVSSLAQGAGVDAGKLGSIVEDLKSGLASGDSAKVGQAIGDLLALLAGGEQAAGGEKAAGSGGGSPAGAPPASGAAEGESGGDILSMLEKLLEALGLSKEQIAKIMGAAKEAGVGGGETSAEGSGLGDSVGGVKAA